MGNDVIIAEIEEGKVVSRSADDLVVGIAVASTFGRNEGSEVKSDRNGEGFVVG